MKRSFPEGKLWELVAQRSQQAQAAGNLLRLDTDEEVIVEADVRFLLRISRNLARKWTATQRETPSRNPFLPYEPELFVADAGSDHILLLNKFNVLENHLLIITREFELQESLLTLGDFEALCRCLAERESLGFYNSGPDAGASQPHKHLQIVPLPLSPQTAPLPIAPLLDRGDGLPFPHFHRRLARLPRPEDWALALQAAYRDGLETAGIKVDEAGKQILRPYNLLVTRERLLLVPRSRDRFLDISINALGFAGSFFVKNREDGESLRRMGPLRMLREVAG